MAMICAEGTYRAKVIEKELTEAKTGTPQVAITYEVTEGDHAGETIRDYAALSEKALPYTVAKMRACGWTGVDVSALESLGSKECQIVVATDVYNGESRLRVKFVNDLDRAAPSIGSMDAAKKKAMAAKLRGLIAGLDPSQARAAAQPQRSKPPVADTGTDDDIPF